MRRRFINSTPIVDAIIKKMEERGMSQKELSDITGIPTPTLNEILGNKRRIQPRLIVPISIVLGLDAIELGRMQSDFEIVQVIQPIMEQNKQK